MQDMQDKEVMDALDTEPTILNEEEYQHNDNTEVEAEEFYFLEQSPFFN